MNAPYGIPHWITKVKKLQDWIEANQELLTKKWSWERAKVAIQYLNNPYLEMDVMKPHRVLWCDFFPVLDSEDQEAITEFLETEWAVRTLKMSGQPEEDGETW